MDASRSSAWPTNGGCGRSHALNPMYESWFAAGKPLLSVAMLRCEVHRVVADRVVTYPGIATSICAFVTLVLFGANGASYFWWWLLFVVWFGASGWKLIGLGTVTFPSGNQR